MGKWPTNGLKAEIEKTFETHRIEKASMVSDARILCIQARLTSVAPRIKEAD